MKLLATTGGGATLPTAPLATPPMLPHQAYIDGLAASVGIMNAYNFGGLGITWIDAALIQYLFYGGGSKSFSFAGNAITNVDELLTEIANFCQANYVSSFTLDFSGGTNASPTPTALVGGYDALSGTYIRQSDGTYYQPDHGYIFSRDASNTWGHSSGLSASVAPTPWEADWAGSSLEGIVSQGTNADVTRLQNTCYATVITN